MVSILDLARQANVSAATASRVLNNSSHPVSQATRLRVLQAAKELNYRPNALARAMITQRTRIIAVIVGDSSDPYFSAIVHGIEMEARDNGYLVIICNTGRNPMVERDYLRLLSDYQVDGIVFAGGGKREDVELLATVAELQSENVALVALNPHEAIPAHVRVDNTAAAREMTAHLLGLGHRRIALIHGPEELKTAVDRRQGYCQALEANNVHFDPELVWAGDFTFESGVRAAQHYLDAANPPTALFAANDQTAVAIIATLRQAGVRIPEDVSVAGFDDIQQARYTTPSLTTIGVPMQQLGREGVRHLLAQLSSQKVEPLVCLPYRLIIRESTGSAPATSEGSAQPCA